MRAVVMLLSLAACGGARPAPPAPESALAPTPAPPPAPATLESRLDELAAAMCACKDHACADEVNRKLGDFVANEAQKLPHGDSQADTDRTTAAGKRFGECRARLATTDPPAGAVEMGASGLPVACEQFKTEIERILRCPKIAQQKRDRLAASYEETQAAWAGVPKDGMPALAEACRTATDSVKAGADATSCPY